MLPSLCLSPLAALEANVPGVGPDLTRYLMVCAVLVAGIALLGFGLQRLVGRSVLARAERRALKVIDVLPLGGKHKLLVVRCYDRTFVLGMGEREVGLVAELDGEALAASLPAQPRRSEKRDFRRWLEGLAAPTAREGAAPQLAADAASATAAAEPATRGAREPVLGSGKGILV